MAAKFIGIYSISKYALLGLTETLAAELAPEGIGVTALMPGPVRTTHSLSSESARPKELPGARPLHYSAPLSFGTTAFSPLPDSMRRLGGGRAQGRLRRRRTQR